MYTHSDNNVAMGYSLAKSLDLKPVLYYIDTISPRIEKGFNTQEVHSEYNYDVSWKKVIDTHTLEGIDAQLTRLNLDKQEFEFTKFDGCINDGLDHLKSLSDVDMISVGATHHGRIHRFFLNTFVEKNLFNLKKDILVVKNTMSAIKHITYIMPFGSYIKSDLDKVCRIAKATKAKVLIDTVIPIEYIGYNLEVLMLKATSREVLLNQLSDHHKKAEEEMKHVCSILKQQGIDCKHTLKLILNKSPGKVLNELVIKENSDLIIMKPIDQIFEHLSASSTTLDFLRNVKRNFYLLTNE